MTISPSGEPAHSFHHCDAQGAQGAGAAQPQGAACRVLQGDFCVLVPELAPGGRPKSDQI